MSIGEKVIIKGVKDSNNIAGADNIGYNGTFFITDISDDNMTFTVDNTNVPAPTTPSTDIYSETRSVNLPRYQRNDILKNMYVYRNEVISEYIEGQQDGVYHVYLP